MNPYQNGKGSIIYRGDWIDILSVDFRASDLTAIHRRPIAEAAILRILKSRVFATEGEQHIAGGSFTVLGDDDLCHATQVVACFILIDMVVLRTVNEDHHIRILLNGSGLTQVWSRVRLSKAFFFVTQRAFPYVIFCFM